MARAVIFDFDGVIVRTEHIHLRSFRNILAPFGIRISTARWNSEFVGLYAPAIFERLFREHGIKEKIDNWVDKRRGLFMDYALNGNLHLIPGIKRFLRRLHSIKIPTAIASGSRKSMLLPILSKLGIQNDFCAIIGYEDVEKRKPHPEPFLKAAAALGVLPSRCIAIEDSQTGIESALAAGMRVVCIRSGASKGLKYDVPIINNYNEFPISALTEI